MAEDNKTIEDKLIQALEWYDSDTRLKRIERIKWVGQYEISGGIVGKVEAMSLLGEARDCYVQGYFIAALMLATALIEHVIAEELIDTIKANYSISFIESIKYARKEKLFPDELLDDADRLRELRNPFAHHKPPNHTHSLGNRYMSQERHPEDVKEVDAKEAVVAMYAFFKHTLRQFI